MVKQMIIEMEEGLVKATSGWPRQWPKKESPKAQAVAANQARQWEEKATMALKGGNTDLAKQALSKKVVYDGQVQQYQAMVTQASNTTSQLRMQLDTLKGKLDEARMKQSTLVARSQTAKTQKEFSTILGTNVGQWAFAKFDKMEKKIEGMEAEAEAFSELSGEGPADDPFKSMEKDMQVDDEMAKLLEKMNLGGGANA